MTETRHRTVIEIGVDDREVRGLGATMDRTFSTKTIDAFERSLDRTSRTLNKLIEQQTRLTQVLDRMDQRQRQGAARQRGEGGGGGGLGGMRQFGRQSGATAIGSYLGNVAARGVGGTGAVSTAAGAIPFVGPIIQGAIQAMQGFYQSYAAQQMARGGVFGATGMTSPQFGAAELAGARAGVMPGASAQMMGQFAQQTGMVGPGLAQMAQGRPGQRGGQGLFGLAQVMGFRNIGGILGGAGAATPGGRTMAPGDAFDTMAEAVSTGMTAGFREGRLDQFFAQFGGWLEQIRTGGIQISAGSALQLVRGTGMLGRHFQGEAGLRATQGFQQAMTRAGQRPGQASLMMLRAGGMRGGGFGTRTFMEARRALEENPAEAMQNFMQIFRRVTRGASASQAAMFAEQAFNQLGMQMTAGQALDFGEATTTGGTEGIFTTGREQGEQDVREMVERRMEAGLGRRREGGRRRGGALRGARAEAFYELQRIDVGRRVQGAARALRNFEIALARDFMPVMGSVIQWLTRAGELMRAGDWTGLGSHMTEGLRGAQTAAAPVIREATRGVAARVREQLEGTPFAEQNPSLMRYLDMFSSEGGTNWRAWTGGGGAGGGGGGGAGRPGRPRLPTPRAPGPGLESDPRGPQSSAVPAGDPIDMIALGGRLITEGAERLRNEGFPGEADVGQAAV